MTARVVDRHRPGVEEAGLARHGLDPVALEVPVDLVGLARRHVGEPAEELPEASLSVEAKRHPVELPAPEAGEVERRLAEGLRRESAGVDGRAARRPAPLHHGDAPAEVRAERGSLLSGRAGSQDDEVVPLHVGHSHPPVTGQEREDEPSDVAATRPGGPGGGD